MQLGIGAVPDAVLASSCRAPPEVRRIWSEMFSDGVLRLERGGARFGRAVGDFELRIRECRALRLAGRQCAGAHAAHRNDQRSRPDRRPAGDDPDELGRWPKSTCSRRRMLSALVTGSLRFGRSDRLGRIVGALHSVGGTSLIALPSWHPRADVDGGAVLRCR